MELLTFGHERSDCVEVSVHGYSYSDADDTWDANWLSVGIRVKSGAFQGRFPASFQTTDLLGLASELTRLYGALEGAAKFRTLEDQLSLDFKVDNLGQIHVSGLARDMAGIGNCLTFEMSFDQTLLQNSLEQLARLTRAYPYRG